MILDERHKTKRSKTEGISMELWRAKKHGRAKSRGNFGTSIGTYFFMQFRTTLNFPEKEMLLTRLNNRNYSIDSVIKPSHGFYLFSIEGKVTILSISKNSEAEKMGLKVGDEVLELNGFDCRNVTEEDWCDMDSPLRSHNWPNELEMTVLSNGEERKVKLKKSVLWVDKQP